MIDTLTPSSPLVEAVYMTPAANRLHDVADVLTPGWHGAIDLTILVSCYNEGRYIISTLETVRAGLAMVGGISYEILVIDDCSRDGSVGLVRDYIDAHPSEHILLRQNRTNRGLAQNYIDGAFIGVGKYYRLICGDDAEPKETIARVLRELGHADILIPYYLSVEGKTPYRRLMTKAYSTLINKVTGFRLQYYNGLAVHLRHNVMRWHPNTRGFGFQADIICMLLDQGCTYKEIPVTAVERKGGESRALTVKNILSVTHTLVDIGIRRASNRVNKWM
jgi:glycosyltransferase involved in cell wall biosynthesis